jgi:PKD repeat protein
LRMGPNSWLIVLFIVLSAVVMMSSMGGAETADIAPEDSLSVTVALHKGEEVTWSWTAEEFDLDFEIKDPDADKTYEVSDKASDAGKFTATMTGDWAFIWTNDQPVETEDYTITLDYQIDVANTAPTASIVADVTIGDVPLEVQFTGSGLDGDGNIVSYSWDLGDGTTSTDKDVTHTYADPGTYEANLTVTDDDGATAYAVIIITVNPFNPVIESISLADGATGVPVDVEIDITFSLSMDKTDVEAKTSAAPEAPLKFQWDTTSKLLKLSFEGDLAYTTTYTITIGTASATTGGTLPQASTLSFTTEDAPTVTITSPEKGKSFKKGDKVTVTGTSTGIPENAKITVRFSGVVKDAVVDANGSWSVEFEVTKGGEQTIAAEHNGAAGTVKVDVEDDAEGTQTLLWLAIVVVIVIAALLGMMLLTRKGRGEEAKEEEISLKPAVVEEPGSQLEEDITVEDEVP